MIDRLAPTVRPSGPNAGTQHWRQLAFLHWEVDPVVLRRLVPAELDLDLDLWNGAAYVGIVPFAMEAVRPGWLPRALALDLLETNVRTYVHLGGRDPGVYFFSLDAASRLAVWGARATFGLPYFHAKMSMIVSGDEVAYETTRSGAPDAHLRVRYHQGAPLGTAQPGTLDHFLIERYLLYVKRGSHIEVGQVHHQPYPLRSITVSEVDEGLLTAAGLPATSGLPAQVHLSPGVDVEVFALRPTTRML